MALEPGTRLGPYEILSPISGTGSESYKANDTESGRTVRLTCVPSETSEDPDIRERLEREVRALAALDHPHVAIVYDVARHADADYVVGEYLEGETLAERLTRGPIDLDEALETAVAIADALDRAHGQGITHRSLNPSNIILTADRPKLTDFGVVVLADGSGTAASTSNLSTRTSPAPVSPVPDFAAPYLAPEQYDRAPADARTDIFALGAVVYEMMTGRPAFEGTTLPLLVAEIQTVDPEPMSKLEPMTPPALEYVVRRCLAKNPDERLQSARDLLSHLRWIREGGSQAGIPAPVAARRRNRDRLFWVASAAVLLVALGLVGLPVLPRLAGAR